MPEGMTEDVEFPGGHVHGAADVELKIHELVEYCRSPGKTWTEIGQAFGMSKQAAWERFLGDE